MKLFVTISLLFIASCQNYSTINSISFKRNIPDTSKTWSGKMTNNCFILTRHLQQILGQSTLVNGTSHTVIRIWRLSGIFDPQLLINLEQGSINTWQLNTISFNAAKPDSQKVEYSKSIPSNVIDSIHLNRYWTLPSQSELKAPDSFGCADGEDIFIELADSVKYRFMWYRCPELNKYKDSVFELINQLSTKLTELTFKHLY